MEVPIPMGAACPWARGHKRRRHGGPRRLRSDPMLAHLPQGRRIAASAAFCLCVAVLIVTAFRGLSDAFLVRGAQAVAIAVAAIGLIGVVIATVTGRLADYTDPADEDEFEELVRRSERLARDNLAPEPDE